jgi:hypothetical protein
MSTDAPLTDTRDYPVDKDMVDMTTDEKIAFLRHVERLEVKASKWARRVRENIEADQEEESS